MFYGTNWVGYNGETLLNSSFAGKKSKVTSAKQREAKV